MNRYRRLISIGALISLFASVWAQPVSASYNPTLGRWLQPDPHGTGLIVTPGLRYHGASPVVTVSAAYQLQFADGMNFYQFVSSKPVSQRDPTGLFPLFGTLHSATQQAYIQGYMFAAAHPAAMQLAGGLLAAANLYAFAVYDEARAIVVGQPNPGGIILGELTAIRLAIGSALRFGGAARGLLIADDGTRSVASTATAITESLSASEAGAAEALISRARWPSYAARVEIAHANGYPVVLTLDRTGANTRRATALKGIPKVPGMDLDEYPPAMFKEGGLGASVEPIPLSENRAAGASIARQLENYPDGTKVVIRVVP